jgi:hypothetical protein
MLILAYCGKKYMKYYAMIYALFLEWMYTIIVCQECPILSKKDNKILLHIGNCYIKQKHTYLNIFVATHPPNLLLAYVIDKVVLGDIFYHTIF